MTANSMAAQDPPAPTPTHPPAMNAASAADCQAVCHFLDKVAAEIRVMIYEHVFGTSEYARFSPTPVNQRNPAIHADSTAEATPAMINTSILATSKQIREEALDAFCNTKIVRLDFNQLRSLLDLRASRQSNLLDLVLNIHIVDCNQADPEHSVLAILKEALALPRIKSLSMLSDCLTGPDRRHVTVREEAHRLGLGTVICCDVGRYSIDELLGKVQFINSKLVRMWPSAASMPDDFDALEVAYATRSGRGLTEETQNLMAWASHTSLRLWVGLHEVITARQTNDEGSSDDDDSAAAGESIRRTIDRIGFLRAVVSDPPTVRHISDSPDQNVPLHKLGPQHDPIRLEQATELLAMNIGRYKWAQVDEDFWDTEKEIEPSWVELGHPNVLDIQQENQHRLRTLWREHSTIEWPTDQRRLHMISNVREELLGCGIFSRVFGQQTIVNAGKRELQQLWYLRLALYAQAEDSQGDGPSNDQRANDDGDGRDQENDQGMGWESENGAGHDETTETPEAADEEADGVVEKDKIEKTKIEKTALHEWSAELMRKYLSRVEGIDKTVLSEASEKQMRKALFMVLGFALGLFKALATEEVNSEGTGPGSPQSSTEQPENTAMQASSEERSGDELGGDSASDEPSNIDEDVYQPFLNSYAVTIATVFKATMAGDFDQLDLGTA